MTMAGAGAGDFVYLDPPYCPVSNSANFTQYTAVGFTYPDHDGSQMPWPGVAFTDHERLLAALRDLDARGVAWALSNADVPAMRAAYAVPGWTTLSMQARRGGNSDAAKRGKVGELLVLGRIRLPPLAKGSTKQLSLPGVAL